MNDFRADLHTHSLCSDGSLNPTEVLQLAKHVGLKGISITDHDTLEAYDSNLLEEAKRLDILLLPGAELSSQLGNVNLHILAYGRGLLNDSFKSFLKEIQHQRIERNQMILEKLNQNGIEISEKELKEFAQKELPHKSKIIGRPHIALLMLKKGYVTTIQEAFNKYIKDDAPCYAKGAKFNPETIIDHVHKSKGVAIIAHPHFYKSRSFIDKLLNLPFDGIECYYSKIDPFYEKKWVDIATKKRWIITGGSDFHGEIKPHIPLGCSWVNYDTFQSLYNL